MELISTVKMKKAQESVVSLRPFALATLSILGKVSQDEDILGLFSQIPPLAKKEIIILVASQK
jgi:F0F1-type ATP synthase gamma subunit